MVANAQPYWACHEGQMDNLTIPFLGPERSGWQYPFRSLRAAGATLAMGSDWSVSTANPLLEMEVAVTRVSDLSRGEQPPFLPDERIELIDALAAFTAGTAWVNHLEAGARVDRGRQDRRPRRCSIVTCSTGRRARSARRGSSGRSSTVPQSSRTLPSRADPGRSASAGDLGMDA